MVDTGDMLRRFIIRECANDVWGAIQEHYEKAKETVPVPEVTAARAALLDCVDGCKTLGFDLREQYAEMELSPEQIEAVNDFTYQFNVWRLTRGHIQRLMTDLPYFSPIQGIVQHNWPKG